MRTDGLVHLFPVAVPDIFVGFEKPSSSVDRCHSLRSLLPPLAALPSLPNPNTEVKLMYADNSSKHKIQCFIYRKR